MSPGDPAAAEVHELDLDHGVVLRCSMPSLDGSVRVAIEFLDRELFSATVAPGGPPRVVRHEGDLVDASLELVVDAFAGEVAVAGHLRVNPPLRDWVTVFDSGRRVLLRFEPGIGEVGGGPAVHEPLVIDERWGRSQLCTPAALRLYVDEQERALSDCGSYVKKQLFPGLPPFVFNTVACVGQAEGDDELGEYTNPNSHWFNVFFGYYQLDAPKRDWSRPFAYRSAAGVDSEIEIEEIVRLGEADWNFFSNWMYGVPEDVVEHYSRIEMDRIVPTRGEPELIGASLWHPLVLDGVEVASTYESDAPGARELERNTVLVDVWRNAFGKPNPQPDRVESFIPTVLRASVWMSYWEDDDAFHTAIFGGTLPDGGDQAFLDTQMRAVRTVMERSYPDLGFAAPTV